jgi:acyl phosphate:glycerol-3-phosphate acyltransferase
LLELVLLAAAYLVGSLSFAVIVSRFYGLPDPHSYGSGNPGATNVLRTGRRAAALWTLVGDAGKGWLAVVLVTALVARYSLHPATVPAAALAAFLGHLWPVFFGFRGGKGVATAGGILLALGVWLGLATLATWLIIFAFFRISSLAALIAALFAPLWYLFLNGLEFNLSAAAVTVISMLLIVRHRENLRRLVSGEERRVAGPKQA